MLTFRALALRRSELEKSKLAGLATDGCSVMTGKGNGVAFNMRQECKLLLNVHCICHRLALACADANDHISFIKVVKKIKKLKKACRTRWLSTEMAIQGVFEDFVPLTQTLRVFKETEGDSTATGLQISSFFLLFTYCMKFYPHCPI